VKSVGLQPHPHVTWIHIPLEEQSIHQFTNTKQRERIEVTCELFHLLIIVATY
jgi:hypothetical protein